MDSSLVPVISSVVAAIAVISAACISAYFGHKSSKNHAETMKQLEQIDQLKSDLRRAIRQVKAYYELEEIAAEMVSSSDGRASRTVKSELRNRVVEIGLDRPAWTRIECDKRLSELDT